MRHKEIDVIWTKTISLENPSRDLFRLAHRELKDAGTILLHVVHALVDAVVRRRLTAAARRHAQGGAAAAVDLVLEIENHAVSRVCGRHNDSARTVSKQHTGGAVLVV